MMGHPDITQFWGCFRLAVFRAEAKIEDPDAWSSSTKSIGNLLFGEPMTKGRPDWMCSGKSDACEKHSGQYEWRTRVARE